MSKSGLTYKPIPGVQKKIRKQMDSIYVIGERILKVSRASQEEYGKIVFQIGPGSVESLQIALPSNN